MTAQTAVSRGTLVVNVPVMAIIFGGMLISLKLLTGYLAFAVFVLSIPAAWLYWSLAVPRWRIWAIRSGAEPDELQSAALRAGLVWPKGSFFERTELPPRSQDR